MSVEECLALLADHPVGRVAIAQPGQPPLVVPVNYQLDGDAIVFRSDPGLKTQLLAHMPVSFEVDSIDPHHRTGWSVLVHGTAYLATHWETDHLHLDPWAEGKKRIWVRIVPSTITGRRLEPGDFDWPSDGRGYL